MASVILKQKSLQRKGDDGCVGNVKDDIAVFIIITHSYHGFDCRLELTLTSYHYTSWSGALEELALNTHFDIFFCKIY
jgi:hypothetical protein